MSLPPDYVRRAVYAKYSLRRAKELLHQKTILAGGQALLALQDGVEMLMRVVADHLQLPPFQNFMEFWPRVKDKIGTEPPQRAAMDRLNNARVGFKHKGNLPNLAVVSGFLPLAEEFCIEISSDHLGLDFLHLSMAELVSKDTVRSVVQESETLFEAGSRMEALEKLALAFDDLYSFMKDQAKDLMMGEPEELQWLRFDDHQLQRFAGLIVDWSGEVIWTVNMLLLGIDFPAFFFFHKTVPTILRTEGGNTQFAWPHGFPKEPIEERTYMACRDFVIDFSLRNDELFGA
jgi:hypothetical protein